MIAYIVFMLIIGFIYWNITPFIHADTFGHYLRRKEKHYVYSEKDIFGNLILHNNIETETVKEKCNPWLMWWHLVKMKPNIVEWEFDSEETKELWNKIQNN